MIIGVEITDDDGARRTLACRVGAQPGDEFLRSCCASGIAVALAIAPVRVTLTG